MVGAAAAHCTLSTTTACNTRHCQCTADKELPTEEGPAPKKRAVLLSGAVLTAAARRAAQGSSPGTTLTTAAHVCAGGTQPNQPASRELRNLAIEPSAFAAELVVIMEEDVKRPTHGPRSGGRISGERVPAPDCRNQHGRYSFMKCKCLYWQREWGDVPRAITEASAAAESKGKK